MNDLMARVLDALSLLAPRLGLDVLCATAVIHGIYLRKYPRRDYGFTYWLLNLITFAVAFMLAGVRVEMGLSLGLFAVFGILRYRTEAMRIRDLTYLFVMIGLAILNGVATDGIALARVVWIDGAVVLAVAALEALGDRSAQDTVVVRYDRLELLPASHRAELLADLTQRLGMPCERVVVENVDLMHDSAELVVTYRAAVSPKPAS
jgi:hypothetical protein